MCWAWRSKAVPKGRDSSTLSQRAAWSWRHLSHLSRGMQYVTQAQKQPPRQHIAYVSGFKASNITILGLLVVMAGATFWC